MIDCKGSQCEKAIIMGGVRWDVAYPISYRPVEERRQERGGVVDPSPLKRWVSPYAPEVAKQCRRRPRSGGKSGPMEEPSGKGTGSWKDRYRAVDKDGPTVDFLLPPPRERAAAAACLHQALRVPGLPEQSTLEQRGSNPAAIPPSKKSPKTAMVSRQCQ